MSPTMLASSASVQKAALSGSPNQAITIRTRTDVTALLVHRFVPACDLATLVLEAQIGNHLQCHGRHERDPARRGPYLDAATFGQVDELGEFGVLPAPTARLGRKHDIDLA